MVIIKIYENIGWSNFRNDLITITNYYSPSNDYEGSEVKITCEKATSAKRGRASSEIDAIWYAMQAARPEVTDEEMAEVIRWLLRH